MQCATGDQRYLSLVCINGGVCHFNVGLFLEFRYLTSNFGILMVRICNSHMKLCEISNGLICIDFFLISQLKYHVYWEIVEKAVLSNRSICQQRFSVKGSGLGNEEIFDQIRWKKSWKVQRSWFKSALGMPWAFCPDGMVQAEGANRDSQFGGRFISLVTDLA